MADGEHRIGHDAGKKQQAVEPADAAVERHRQQQHRDAQEFRSGGSPWLKRLPLQIAFIVAGLALLVLGAHWLVGGAVAIARLFGVRDRKSVV